MSTLHPHERIRVLIHTYIPAIGTAMKQTLLRLSEGEVEVEVRESRVFGTRAWIRPDLDVAHPAVSLARTMVDHAPVVVSRRAPGDAAVEAEWDTEIATLIAEGAGFDICIRANPRMRETISDLLIGDTHPAHLAAIVEILGTASFDGRVDLPERDGVDVFFAAGKDGKRSGLSVIWSWLHENGWPDADVATDTPIPILVECDDPEGFPLVEKTLAEAGFGPVTFGKWTSASARLGFMVQFELSLHYSLLEKLNATIPTMQDALGVDSRLFGVRTVPYNEYAPVHERFGWRVALPFAAARAGAIQTVADSPGTVEPTTGDLPQRFVLHLHTDDVSRVTQELVPVLLGAGFRAVEVDDAVSSTAADIEVQLRRPQFPETVGTLTSLLEGWRTESGLPGEVTDRAPADPPRNVVDVHIPIGLDEETRHARRIEDFRRHRVFIRGGGSLSYALRDALEARGVGEVVFQGVEQRRLPDSRWAVEVGSASNRVGEAICQDVERVFGFRPPLRVQWHGKDHTIMIHVPEVIVEGIEPPEYRPFKGGMGWLCWNFPNISYPPVKPGAWWWVSL